MKLSLHVTIDGMHYGGRFGVNIPEQLEQAWEPKDKCDDAIMKYVGGSNVATRDEMVMVMRMRKDAAETLAKQLTELIVEAMSQKDTTNGYPNK